MTLRIYFLHFTFILNYFERPTLVSDNAIGYTCTLQPQPNIFWIEDKFDPLLLYTRVNEFTLKPALWTLYSLVYSTVYSTVYTVQFSEQYRVYCTV